MAWTLAQAKIYLGPKDPDTPEGDIIIQQVLDETLEALETVLGRQLLLAREVVRFLLVTSDTVMVPRFPIKEIHAISSTGLFPPAVAQEPFPGGVNVQFAVGWIQSPTFAGQREVSVDYEGGFDPLPADLERAMWSAFLTLYDDTDPVTGAPPVAGGSTIVAGSGDVSSVTIADFGTVKYDVGSAVSAAQTGDLSEADWGWLQPWASTFQFYRAGQAGTGLGVV